MFNFPGTVICVGTDYMWLEIWDIGRSTIYVLEFSFDMCLKTTWALGNIKNTLSSYLLPVQMRYMQVHGLLRILGILEMHP